jgi:ribose/xylose/arabinose/galactoside ABC-type transport system permease subunit
MNIKDLTGSFSKKLTLAASSVLFIVLTEWAGVDISFEKLFGIVSIVVSYLIGQSFIDVKKEQNKTEVKKDEN